MDDDFNTATAITLLHELVRALNRYGNNKKLVKRAHAIGAPAARCFALSGRVLGLGALHSEDWYQQVRQRRLAAVGRSEAEVQAMVDARLAARAAKDWAAADAIRGSLDALGVVLMDSPTGTRWRMKVD